MTNNTEPRVEQRHRDAAAALHGELWGTQTYSYQLLLDGELDGDPLVRAFARFEASLTRPTDVREAIDLAALAQFMDEVRMERTSSDWPEGFIRWLPYHEVLR